MTKVTYFNVLSFVALLLVSAGIFTLSPEIVLAKAKCTNLTKDLDIGSTNSKTAGQVTILQDFLKSAGYSSSAASGRYGAQTAAAVKKFQLAKSITASGKVGPLTRVAIKKASCSSVAVVKKNTKTKKTKKPKTKKFFNIVGKN